MNWINLNVVNLDSEEFLGAEPVERATWLCLLRYCAGQENGGRIEGCREWKDRKWQQLVRVTAKEAAAECDLWTWDGDDIVVRFYPEEKESEVKHLRAIGKQTSKAKSAAAKANGSKGGRPKNNRPENPAETQQETQIEPIELEVEGKGIRKEGEGEAAGGSEPTETQSDDLDIRKRIIPLPSKDDCLKFAKASMSPPITSACAEAYHDDRAAVGWVRKSGLPIADWRADLRGFANRWNEYEKAKGGTPTKAPGKKFDWD